MSANIDLFKKAAIRAHNFQAVPRDLSLIIKDIDTTKQKSQPIKEIFTLPQTKIISEAFFFVQKELPSATLNHSLRVYQYGLSMAEDFFSDWQLNKETWALACLFHDIGTSGHSGASTLLSFEYHGGILTHTKLRDWKSPLEQCDAVAEAIIRHQDIDDIGKGNITRLGALLQLATLYDNAGQFSELIHPITLENVTIEYPRLKWSTCFSAVIAHECESKPWCHTTKIGKQEFLSMIKDNTLGNSRE